MSQPNALDALSPLDGRYADDTAPLRNYFSEYAYLRDRVRVEIAYLIALARDARLVRPCTNAEIEFLRALGENFSASDAARIKAIERTTRHDVKAIEYFLREQIAPTTLSDVAAWLHFALTSEDVNQIAQALALRAARDAVIIPALDAILARLADLARAYAATPMLARTHGQPAVPTTLGKEFAVFLARLQKQRATIHTHRLEAKLTGAVGNFNAHAAAASQVDWLAFSAQFIRAFDLEPNLVTTQILPYDNWLEFFDALRRANAILIDLAQDGWRYISDDVLALRVVASEVGSSTMPHKVNPIDFENAEGNLGLANALFAHYADKLAVSRLQRDLSDSTVRRTFGVALGHTLVAYQALTRGLSKIAANETRLRADLDAHWDTVTEGAQTILRAAGVADAYEKLKALARGKTLTQTDYATWVAALDVDDATRAKLHALSPFTYIGLAEQIVKTVIRVQ